MAKKSVKSKEALTTYYVQMMEIIKRNLSADLLSLESKHNLRVEKLKEACEDKLKYYTTQIELLEKTS